MRIAERPYLTLFTVGLIVHLAVLGFLQVRSGGMDAYTFRSPDAREYYALARNVAESGVFSQQPSAPFRADTWRTPGYPIFLALLITFFGDSPVALVLAQHGGS